MDNFTLLTFTVIIKIYRKVIIYKDIHQIKLLLEFKYNYNIL